MKNTEIILIRHGQSVGNLNRVYLGHTDLPLSEEGRSQAEITAKHLENVKIDVIYSSDLKRAHETAVPHAVRRGLPVTDSRGLREIFLGEWENKPVEELKNNYYDEFILEWHGHFGTCTPPGGESVLNLANRIYAELERIASENLGKRILITTHAAAIRAFWCKINGIEPENMAKAFPFPTNASYSTLVYDGERFIPVEYSCDSHFQQPARL